MAKELSIEEINRKLDNISFIIKSAYAVDAENQGGVRFVVNLDKMNHNIVSIIH